MSGEKTRKPTAAPRPHPAPPQSRTGPAPETPLSRAERFIWLTARVLEQRRFAFHFRAGEREPVETALDSHQNPDGGYGHALDPDVRGPLSHPLHACHALRVLDSLGRCAGRRVERLCHHLSRVSTPDGALPAMPPGAATHPSAPHLPTRATKTGDLRTTGPVVGLLHRNQVWHAWLFRATDHCWAHIESLHPTDPHEIRAAVDFLDGVPDRSRALAAADRLGRLVRERPWVVLDPRRPQQCVAGPGGPPGRLLRPLDFAPRPESLARGWFTDEEMGHCLDHLAAAQEPDGGWPNRRHPWTPAIAPESRPIETIEALRTLRAYGRPVG
ncbi:hypothetical protein [Streptomyces sp. NPDC006879]|uniref:hypothetical protein n=1 Tax=Streptomyces sp. NPDC006879 TaxID=3364767 RepID=UPI0036C4E877